MSCARKRMSITRGSDKNSRRKGRTAACVAAFGSPELSQQNAGASWVHGLCILSKPVLFWARICGRIAGSGRTLGRILMLKSNKTFMVFIRTAKQHGVSSEQKRRALGAIGCSSLCAQLERGPADVRSRHELPLKAQFITLLVGLSFIAVGVEHFNPGLFVPIVPPFLPAPLELVYISGFFEVAGGVGLVSTRRPAGWGRWRCWSENFQPTSTCWSPTSTLTGWRGALALWARMPLQFVDRSRCPSRSRYLALRREL